MRLPLTPLCADGPVVWGHDGSLPGFGVLGMHTERADTQITTVVNQNMTAPLDATVSWYETMAAPFCALDPVPTTMKEPGQRGTLEAMPRPTSTRYHGPPLAR